MPQFVVNREDSQASVNIHYSDGRVDTVFIQPFSRARIPDGSSVARETLMLNPKLQLINTDVAQRPPTQAAASSDTPAA